MDKPNRKFKIRGVRYLFSLATFLGCFVNFALRVNINVAIVAMVNSSAVYNPHNKTVSYECGYQEEIFSNSSESKIPPKDGEFLWSPQMQGHVLGAFYYGYSIIQIPGGRLSEIYSAKWVFGLGTLVTALLSFLSPIAARFDVAALIAIRSLQGVAQGVVFPSVHSMLGRWLPDTERNFLSSAIYCGINLGSVAGMAAAGVLCNSDWFGGWPSSFYVTGVLGCVWFILWSILVTDTPHHHPLINNSELDYIVSNQRISQNTKLPPFPWRKVLTSLPFWALLIDQIGMDWSFYTLLNDLPTFFATILHFDIEKNGYLSSTPYFLQTVVMLLLGYTCDTVISKGLVTTNFVRKFCASLSGFVPAIFFIGVCLAGCNATLSVVFLMLAVIFGSCCSCGYMLSHLDLSPEYAGTLMGLSNGISSVTGFLTPIVVGTLTDEKQTLSQWYIVFGITVVILIVTTLFFLCFSTTEKQDWASEDSRTKNWIVKTTSSPVPDDYGSLVNLSIHINESSDHT